jgi:uroporphyrinogen-III synthase
MSTLPLGGCTVGLTAGVRAGEQITLWRRAGAIVHHASLLNLHDLDFDSVVGPSVSTMLDERPEAIVFTSVVGVRRVMSAVGRLDRRTAGDTLLDDSVIIATHDHVADEIAAQGYRADVTKRGGRLDEVIIDLTRQLPDGGRVAIQLPGHPVLSPAWSDVPWDVIPVSTYGCSAADDPAARELVDGAAHGELDLILLPTEAAASALVRIADRLGCLDSLLARSDALMLVGADQATVDRCIELGFERPTRPARSGTEAAIRHACRLFARRAMTLTLDGHELVVRGRLVELDGRELRLSDRERAILARLVEQPGAVVSKDDLVRSVWGGGAVDPHLAEVSIARLRQRFGEAGGCIETIIRRGYRLALA